MGFNGYLVRTSNASGDLFNKYMLHSSYKVAKKVIDVDSYRDADGTLHRNAVDHLSYTVEFDLRPMTNNEMENLMSAVTSSFYIPKERKLTVEFYLPENNGYVTAECYMPDINYTIKDIVGNTIRYDKTTLKFIGY